MGTAQRIIAGGLIGVGEGLIEQARAERDKLLALLKQQGLTARTLLHEARADRRAAQSGGLLTRVVADENNDMVGVTRSGDVKSLGFKGKPTAADKELDGLAVGDKRILDTLIERHTTGKGSLEGEKTDWQAIEKTLRDKGKDDLADLVATQDSQNQAVDVKSPEYREAQRMAEDWASGKAGLLRSDKTDFSDYGGSRAEAIQAKTMEFYRNLTGTEPTMQRAVSERFVPDSTKTGDQQVSGEQIPGSGTQADPYRATTQAELDWFKNNAPAGAIIEVEGKLYRK